MNQFYISFTVISVYVMIHYFFGLLYARTALIQTGTHTHKYTQAQIHTNTKTHKLEYTQAQKHSNTHRHRYTQTQTHIGTDTHRQRYT